MEIDPDLLNERKVFLCQSLICPFPVPNIKQLRVKFHIFPVFFFLTAYFCYLSETKNNIHIIILTVPNQQLGK